MPNIEEHIRRAMEEGKFDDLPGKGKPLRLDENPHEDPEWRLAYRMLRESGFSLPWIETIREIEAEVEKARSGLGNAWAWRQAAISENQPYGFVQGEWERALEVFREQVVRLNKRIRDYNLEVPVERFQRPLLRFEREVEAVTEGGRNKDRTTESAEYTE
jgi:DnaJ homolog subfamily C member 28